MVPDELETTLLIVVTTYLTIAVFRIVITRERIECTQLHPTST